MEFAIKTIFGLAAVYSLYYCFLRKETWFHLQRVYILGSTALVLFLSMSDHSLPKKFDGISTQTVKSIDLLEEELFDSSALGQTKTSIPLDPLIIMWYIYLSVTIILSARFIFSIILLLKLRIKYGIETYNGTNVVFVDSDIKTFSFLHTVYMNKLDFSKIHHAKILSHEQAHINQLHSIDLLLFELLQILLWFNPFVFLFKQSIRNVHEYLADEEVLHTGITNADYAQLLLQQTYQDNHILMTSSFNSSIKKRLVMISKIKSTNNSKLKFTLLVPVIALIYYTYACTNSVTDVANLKTEQQDGQVALISTKQNLPSQCPIEGTPDISASWGNRMHPIYKVEKHHSGCDIKASEKTPVHATADGTVSFVKDDFILGKGYGRYIDIQHGNGVQTRYAQLSEYNVKSGQTIQKGAIIGFVGSSGISTGAHLHYEVLIDGKDVNPEAYFE